MAIIETKFDVGQKVYLYDQDKHIIFLCEICAITYYGKNTDISYSLKSKRESFAPCCMYESAIFASIEECAEDVKKHLVNNHKP